MREIAALCYMLQKKWFLRTGSVVVKSVLNPDMKSRQVKFKCLISDESFPGQKKTRMFESLSSSSSNATLARRR